MKDLKRQTVKTWRFLEYFSEKARRGESGYPHFSEGPLLHGDSRLERTSASLHEVGRE